MRIFLAGLLLMFLGCVLGSPEAEAALRVSPNTFNVNPGHGIKVLARIENNSGQFRVRGQATLCFRFSSVTGCTGDSVLGFQATSTTNFPAGFVDGFDANIAISALVTNKVQALLEQNPVNALFFWVIELVPAAGVDLGNGANVPFFVQVNFRMLGGSSGAKSLSITRIKLTADEPGGREGRNVIITEENRGTGQLCLEIWYTGTGKVVGSWQAITNNHPEPNEAIDLMTEASLTEAERRLQRDFLIIEHIRTYFGPKGYIKLTLPYSKIPPDIRGLFEIFPRFKAVYNRRANISNATSIAGNEFTRGGLTAEGKMPQIRVLNGILGEPYPFMTDTKVGIMEALDGQPRRLVVTWTSMTDRRLVVSIKVRNPKTGSVETAIVPITNGKVYVPLNKFDRGETLNDIEVEGTILGLDGKPHPDAKSFMLSDVSPATQ